MARRLMSRRGGSASQPQVTPYQQLELDDGWREWENTKQELVLVKRQLGEKDALVLQLKTASRRLQETLRKKDKDLQAAFAILRSPQDAKTTRTRKQELIDRLVSECMQRAATSEALAEERRRELERLKYSSKFLRFQELEVEIDECRTEIERLRAKLEAAASPLAIAGKLKVSAVPLTASTAVGFMKKAKLDPLNLTEHTHPDDSVAACDPASLGPARTYSAQNAAGQVRVIPLAKPERREGFVSKTRRRALEAEYYKQVRLAQLEVECELEENLHIRAAREARKLEAIEQQDRHSESGLDSARIQPPGNNDPTNVPNGEFAEEGDPSGAVSGKPAAQQADDMALTPVKAEEGGVTRNVEQPEYAERHEIEEPQTEKTDAVDATVQARGPELTASHHKTYEDEEFDASDGEHSERGGGSAVWNLDPRPPLNPETTQEAINQPADGSNGNSKVDMKHVAWNADPSPSAATTTEQGESDPERVVWNVDPRVAGSGVSADREVGDDEPGLPLEDSVPTEANSGGTVWSADPTPPAATGEELSHAVVDGSDQEEEPKGSLDAIEDRSPWILDPTPSSELTPTANASAEEDQPVWNLDPEPAAAVASSSSEPSAQIEAAAGASLDVVEGNEEGKDGVDAVTTAPTTLLANSLAADNATHQDNNDSSPWNLDRDLPGTAHNSAAQEVDPNHDVKDPTQPSSEADQADPARSAAADQDVAAVEGGSNSAWNLDPTSPAAVDSAHDSQHYVVDRGDDDDNKPAWNLDPRTGDSSAAMVSSVEFAQADGDATIPPTMADNSEGSSSTDEESPPSSNSNSAPANELPPYPADQQLTAKGPDPTFDDDAVAEVPEPSNQRSARLSEDSPSEDGTPDYTPPSTARDSDAADEEDATW